MDRHLLWQWQPQDEPGVEHLHLQVHPDRVTADGMIIGIADGHVFRLHYMVQCKSTYELQTAYLHVLAPNDQTLYLARDQHNAWTDESGQVLSALQGSSEIDIATSPFTNTLPIRRLALQPNQSAEIQVVYITLPDLDVKAARQRYTCLEVTQAQKVYRFESLESGFTAEIVADDEGLILDYPGLFKRVWSQ